jgi:feruloyl esterase
MSYQLRRIGIRVWVLLLLSGLTPWAERSGWATFDCTLSAIQSIAPAETTIVSATPISTPAYCDVIGYVTTTNPGPNQVNFELGLPTAWNGRFLFIGNGGFADSLTSLNPFFPVDGVATDGQDRTHP